MVLALSIGIIDSAAAELVNPKTCAGWKGIAAVEILGILVFMKWFVGKGKHFAQSTRWEPRCNVKQVKQFKAIDTDSDGTLSKAELMAAHHKLGLTAGQAEALFEELDEDKSGSLDMDEVRGRQRYNGKRTASP